jgi:hypothetical protein
VIHSFVSGVRQERLGLFGGFVMQIQLRLAAIVGVEGED